MTRNPEIPIAKSLVDYIFRWLAMEFVPGYRAANAPKRPAKKSDGVGSDGVTASAVSGGPQDRGPAAPAADASSTNGGSTRHFTGDAKPFDYGSGLEQQVTGSAPAQPDKAEPQVMPNLRLAIVMDPLSQQGSEMQADAPACDVCGSITVRSGTCYKCLNCGNSMGCS
jgi:ribonucleoside-diphosphate reductase alpha chain